MKRKYIVALLLLLLTGCGNTPSPLGPGPINPPVDPDIGDKDDPEPDNPISREIISGDFGFVGTRISKYIGDSTNVIVPSQNPSGEAITFLGSNLFLGCSSIESITLPSTLKIIGDNCFDGCSSLVNITIPNGVTEIRNDAFYGCSSITALQIPETVTFIGYRAFYGVDSLPFIVIPNSVETICVNAFCAQMLHVYSKSKLTQYEHPGWNTGWIDPNVPFKYGIDDANILDGMIYSLSDESITIDYYVGNSSSVNVSTTIDGYPVTSISSAFRACTSIQSITIPESITKIDMYAFSGCSSLRSIDLPKRITSIGDDAFSECTSLKSITIPESVESIEAAAFRKCSSLTSIIIPDKVTEIPNAAFIGCTSLKSVIFSNNVTSIGQYAFEDCSSLSSIFIPSSVRFIGTYAFNRCTNLLINCESSDKPTGWSSSWNPSNCPITWDCKTIKIDLLLCGFFNF